MENVVEEKKYKIITEFAPIVSNDILIEYKNKYLLVKRNNEPARGQWWTPGGRLNKNEHLSDSVRRIIKEEAGIRKIQIKRFLGVFEVFCNPGKFGQKDIHYVTFVFLASAKGRLKIKTDAQSSEYKFFKKPPAGSHPFIKKAFHLANKKNIRATNPGTFYIAPASAN